MHTVIWKRLDQEGHDACRFTHTGVGWIIDGTAVFEYSEQAARLNYRLACDSRWASLQADISGWIGKSAFHMSIERNGEDGWSVNGRNDSALKGLSDIDLGFTPASNTNAIRRLNLRPSDEAESIAVWLDTEDWTVKPLRQIYRRIHNNAFEYTSPQHEYHSTLAVDDFGAVTEYPDLWLMLHQGKL